MEKTLVLSKVKNYKDTTESSHYITKRLEPSLLPIW